MPLKVAFISLGCVRNTVDSQDVMGSLMQKGHRIVSLKEADTVYINTCGFIQDAKQESIDAILDMVHLKKIGQIKNIVVMGCLSERYHQELSKEIPEIDTLMGTLRLTANHQQSDVRLTPFYSAYLKICESCYHHCSFCIIPQLKGDFQSRRMKAILADVKRMDTGLVKEVNIIGQDISSYGIDLYGKKSLAALLKKILKQTKSIDWFRLLYTYPSQITDELLDLMANEKRICPYLDIPLQHINDRILKMMNRSTTKKATMILLDKIRKKVPHISLRTSYIVGFPGETDQEFQELLKFIHDYPMERVGVFAYSQEEGTVAATLKNQIASPVKEERKDILMSAQQSISYRLNQRHIGKTFSVLIEQKKKKTSQKDYLFAGRSVYDAPDIDGAVEISSSKALRIGDIVQGKVLSASAYDMKIRAI